MHVPHIVISLILVFKNLGHRTLEDFLHDALYIHALLLQQTDEIEKVIAQYSL